MKKILENVTVRIILASVIMSTVSSLLVYKVTENNYEERIISLNKNIDDMRKDLDKLTNKDNKEDSKEEEEVVETIKEETPKEDVRKEDNKKSSNNSNPSVELNKFKDLLVEISGEANWYCETNPNNECMALNSTIMLFKEYSDKLNSVINKVDYSGIGGQETKDSLIDLSNKLYYFKDAENHTNSAADISGFIGELLYQIEENYL